MPTNAMALDYNQSYLYRQAYNSVLILPTYNRAYNNKLMNYSIK